ncbi:predicted protein [Lichtheimia corymbifera JMRC:FSU:9682]|uniref:Uncharacterized protein n=1 Tax=Lichtheimia corymbifera JMRC:FSU:9682 TaxID=1263082 RepID=A0A068S0W1_9FUNG|nr:predicted protein [Lichtheimia corymbifera JMRC:FSU:9682]
MTRRSAHVYPLDRVFFTPSTTSSSPAEQGIRSNTTTTTAMSLKERVSQRLGRFLSIKYDRHHHRHHHLRNNDSSLQQPQQSNATTTSNHTAATTTIKQTYDATPHLYNRHHASMPLTSKDMGIDGTNDDCYYRQDDQPISSLQMPVLPTALRPPPRPHYHHNRRAAIQQPFNDRCKSATVIMFGANSHFDIVRNDIAAKDGDDEDDDDRHSFFTSLEQVDSEQEEDDDEDDLYPQQQVAMSVTILPAAMAAATAARSRRYRARAAKAAAAAAYL